MNLIREIQETEEKIKQAEKDFKQAAEVAKPYVQAREQAGELLVKLTGRRRHLLQLQSENSVTPVVQNGDKVTLASHLQNGDGETPFSNFQWTVSTGKRLNPTRIYARVDIAIPEHLLTTPKGKWGEEHERWRDGWHEWEESVDDPRYLTIRGDSWRKGIKLFYLYRAEGVRNALAQGGILQKRIKVHYLDSEATRWKPLDEIFMVQEKGV